MAKNSNSEIDVSSFKKISKEIAEEIKKEFFSKYTEIPKEFNWARYLVSDTEDVKRKKSLISPVKNQHLCGCCWAISCASAISDAFVVRGLVDWNPSVSYTYALSHYPQQKCSGGSSRILLEDIKNGGGIASDHCVDDGWCVNNPKCVTSDSSKHFFSDNKKYLSSLIPPEGCYFDSKYFLYKLEDVYSMTVSDSVKIFETQNLIKQHIMIRGPVVAGFLIMEDFIDGSFAKTGDGIYLEKSPNNKDKKLAYSLEKDSIVGSHSVVVVGWGVQKNSKYKEKFANIPYWFCRNSWGSDWGESGYFKLAMYPYNRICQISKLVKVIHKGKIKEVGGVTGFEVSKPPSLVNFSKTIKNSKEISLKKYMKLDYSDYELDENIAVGKKRLEKNYSETGYATILVIAAVLLFVMA